MDPTYRSQQAKESKKVSTPTREEMELELKESPYRKQKTKPKLEALDKEFQEAAFDLAGIIADEEALKPNQLLPKKVLQLRYQKQIEEEFAAYKKRLENGASKLVRSLIELSNDNPDIFSQELVDGINRIAGLSDIIAKDEEGFSEQISSGISLQELAHVSDGVIDKLYLGAKRLFDQKVFDDSADAFLFLTSINAKKHAFWLGLGSSEYGRKHYEEALNAYAFASETNMSDPNCHIMSYRCYEELGQIDNAINSLDSALCVIEGQSEYADWKSVIQSEKQRLNKLLNH